MHTRSTMPTATGQPCSTGACAGRRFGSLTSTSGFFVTAAVISSVLFTVFALTAWLTVVCDAQSVSEPDFTHAAGVGLLCPPICRLSQC